MKILHAALPLALIPTGWGLACLLPGSETVPLPAVPTSLAATGPEATPRDLSAPLALSSRSRSAVQGIPIGVREAIDLAPLASAQPTPSSQSQRPVELPLPIEPLLNSEASPDQFRIWYECFPTSELVRNHARLRGLTQFLKAHASKGLDRVVLKPEARRMLADPDALLAETSWLAGRLSELRKAPFVGALPVLVGDLTTDFQRQFRSMNLEQIEIARSEIDHAFRFEKERLVEACFQAGLYTSRLRTRSGWG